MSFNFEERLSDSPLVERIWRTRSDGLGGSSFISQAVSHWEMVITQQANGVTTLTLRGPETLATTAPIPIEAEFIGIQFKLGSFMPHLPTNRLVDNSLNLPEANKSFWLASTAWQFPDYENADTFVNRLVNSGLLVQDEEVATAIQGHAPKDLSLRSLQRRFLRATGLTHTTIHQIERARRAAALLEQGVSILDTVELAGYSDQAHLTRAFRRFLGQSPAQILRLRANYSR